MNPRILKKVLKEISSQNQEPSSFELKNHRIGVLGLRVSVISLVIAIIIGCLGIWLVDIQIKMSKEQEKTSLDIVHFDSLLNKMDTLLTRQSELTIQSTNQISKLVSLDNSLNLQKEILKKQLDIYKVMEGTYRDFRENEERKNIADLFITAQGMDDLINDGPRTQTDWDYELAQKNSLAPIIWDSTKISTIFNDMLRLADEERKNPILRQNPKLFNKLINIRRNLKKYLRMLNVSNETTFIYLGGGNCEGYATNKEMRHQVELLFPGYRESIMSDCGWINSYAIRVFYNYQNEIKKRDLINVRAKMYSEK